MQTLPHRHPLVEDKTFTLPAALRCRNCFQVLEDATAQVVDLVKTPQAQQRCRLFAADSSGAEHRHLGLAAILRSQRSARTGLGFQPRRKLRKTTCARVKRPGEAANRHFVVVAGIDQHEIGVIQQAVPILRLHVLARQHQWTHAGYVQGNDLRFQAHLEPHKGGCFRPGLLVLQIGQPCIGAQPGQHCPYTLRRTGDSAIDAFRCQQQSPFYRVVKTDRVQGIAQLREIGQIDKLVER